MLKVSKITELIIKRDEIAYQMIEAKGKYFDELAAELEAVEDEITQLKENEGLTNG